jgi:hypothetical protein
MSKLFISHSSQDDGFVRQLQQALGDLQQDVWIDSRELRGGDPLWPEIQKAISLQAIVAGSRDRTLADAPDLPYRMAAEILFLIETLEQRGR